MLNCPGSSRFKQPQPEIINCPHCSSEMEMWTDEVKAICPKCNQITFRTEGQSCLDWCRYARDCVGPLGYDKYMQNKTITIKQKLLKEIALYYKDYAVKIQEAENIIQFAEHLLRAVQGDWHIVIPACILHEMVNANGDARINARNILYRLGFKKEDVEDIYKIITEPLSIEQEHKLKNFKIVHDVLCVAGFKHEVTIKNKKKLEELIDKTLFTAAGKELAKNIYLSS